MNPGFRITQGKGFHFTFSNGYTVSVQFGCGSYSDNRNNDPKDYSNYLAHERKLGEEGCATAEVAVVKPNGDFVRLESNDTVRGWVTPEQVTVLLQQVSQLQATDDDVVLVDKF